MTWQQSYETNQWSTALVVAASQEEERKKKKRASSTNEADHDDNELLYHRSYKQSTKVHPAEWKNVRFSKVTTSTGKVKRAKGLYGASVSSSSDKVLISLRRTTEEGKDRVISVETLPQLSDKRIYFVDGFLLDLSSHSDALACVSAIAKALRGGEEIVTGEVAKKKKAKTSSLDLNDPNVQAYIASLLVDPEFESFVNDLASFYTKMKTALPSSSSAIYNNTTDTSTNNNIKIRPAASYEPFVTHYDAAC